VDLFRLAKPECTFDGKGRGNGMGEIDRDDPKKKSDHQNVSSKLDKTTWMKTEKNRGMNDAPLVEEKLSLKIIAMFKICSVNHNHYNSK